MAFSPTNQKNIHFLCNEINNKVFYIYISENFYENGFYISTFFKFLEIFEGKKYKLKIYTVRTRIHTT